MKFADFFVPKYAHSNPEVRLKFVAKTDDYKLLEQMAQMDKDERVRHAAAERADILRQRYTTV